MESAPVAKGCAEGCAHSYWTPSPLPSAILIPPAPRSTLPVGATAEMLPSLPPSSFAGAKWGIKTTLLTGLSLQIVGISVLYAWQDSWSDPGEQACVTGCVCLLLALPTPCPLPPS